ncbi:hypothetical protein NECAME_12922 [Necator americanus]|uniref:Uncharacterized protein n=1 Tax=Necator americanus TaxID=51031 RepID=W2T0P2_NECAM|nr:hypothetical protein NECAME_12922 [Necator americanus]ETN74542.1 hypothetical protein NECAME_12922 [Necator americanus]
MTPATPSFLALSDQAPESKESFLVLRHLVAEEFLCEFNSCTPISFKGLSFYSLVHVDDAEIIRKMHLEVFKLGSYRPPLYRIVVLQGQHHSFYVEIGVRNASEMPGFQESVACMNLLISVKRFSLHIAFEQDDGGLNYYRVSFHVTPDEHTKE